MTILSRLALLAILFAPVYQEVTATRSYGKETVVGNVIAEASWSTVAYDGKLFKSIIGVKTVYKITNAYSVGYSHSAGHTSIQTPAWMQKIGCKPAVSWGAGYLHQSSILDNAYVIGLRLLVKLAIVFLFILTSAFIQSLYEKRWRFSKASVAIA